MSIWCCIKKNSWNQLITCKNFLKYVQKTIPIYMSFLDLCDVQDLLQSYQHFDLLLCQNNFDPRKSNLHPLFFQKQTLFWKDILGYIFLARKSPTRNINKMLIIHQSKWTGWKSLIFVDVIENRQVVTLCVE